MSSRALALGLPLLLCACGSGEKTDPKPRDPSLLRFSTHWDALKSRYPGPDPKASLAQPCYETPQLRVELLRAIEPLPPPPPELQGAEVLIAVEGQGTIELGGKTLPFSDGMVAVLPSGARGALRGTKDVPLLVLAIRHSAPVAVTAGKPQLLRFHQLWKDPIFEGEQAGVFERQVALIPGAIALHAMQVRGGGDLKQMAFWGFPTRVRARRDQVFFQLTGTGSFGTSREGNAVQAGSVVGIPATIEHYFTSYDPAGTRFLIVLAPATDAASIDDDVRVLD